MRLTKLEATGFRSLADFHLDIDELTVLIGENDAGKSSVLDLLDIVLNNSKPDDSDYCDVEGDPCECIEVILYFELEPEDIEAEQYSFGGELCIRNVYSKTNKSLYLLGEKCTDSRLNQRFSDLKKDGLLELICQYDESAIEELSNNQQRIEWLENHAAAAPKEPAWIERPSRWNISLPRFERYSALDYKQPESLILKTLQQVYEQVIYEIVQPENDGEPQRQLVSELRDLRDRVYDAIQGQMHELEKHVRRFLPEITELAFAPEINFNGALKRGEFTINDGRGHHYLSKSGDGTKRRILMGVLQWDSDVTLAQSKENSTLPTVIRGYDEPDTNLHYEAQRSVFDTIVNLVSAEESNVQAVVCTHSLAMINRAPAQSIRLLRLDEIGQTTTEALKIPDDDEEIKDFLSLLAAEFGITNSLMFYERCLFLVEGETEKNALPILYRRLYDRSLIEDGIVLINLKGNGASAQFLRLLSANKKGIVVVMLDRDSEEDGVARLSSKALRNAGFEDEFINERLCLVGQTEFEDTFTNSDIARCLVEHWPCDIVWTEDNIQEVRAGDNKFSNSIIRMVNKNNPAQGYAKKSELGVHLARDCSTIPEEIRSVFEIARNIAETS